MDTDGPPERLRLIYGEVLTNSSPPPLSVLLSSSPFMSSPIPTAATTNGNINSAHNIIVNNANKLAALGSQQCQPQSGDNNYNNGIRQSLNPHALTFIQQQQQLNLGYSHPPPGLAPIMSPGLYSNSNSHANGGSGGGGMINHPPPGLSQAPLSPHCNAPPGFYYPPTQNPTHLYEIPHHQQQHPHPHQSFGTGAQNNNSNGNSSSALYSRPIMPVQAQPQNQNHQQQLHHQQQQQQQHQFPPHYTSPMYLQQQQHVQLPTSQGQGLPLRGNKMAVGESNGNVSSPLGHGPMGGMNMDQYDYELNPRLARLTGAGTSNTTTPNNETIGSGKITATAGPGSSASGLPVGKPMIEPMIENIVGSMSGSTNGTYTHFGPITPGGGIARGPISGGSGGGGGGSASASVVTSTVHLPSRVIGSTSTSFGNEGPGKGHVLAFNSVVSNTMSSNNNNSNIIGSNSKPVLLSESSGKIIAAGVSTVKKAAIVSPSFSGNSNNSNSSVNLKEKLGIVHPRVIGKESPVHSPAEKTRTVSPKEGGSDSRPQTPGKPSYSEILVKNEPKGGSNVSQQKGALTSQSPLPLTAASIARKNSLQLQSDFRDKSPSSSSSSCSSPVTKPKLSMLTGDSTKYTNNYKGKENSNSSSLSSSSKSSTTKSTPNGTPTHNNSSSFSGNNTTHKSSSSRKTSYSGSGGSGNERKVLTGSFTNGNNGTSSTNNEKNRENQSQKTTGAGNNKMSGRATLSSNNSSSNSFQFEFDIEDLDDIHEKMGSGWSTKGQSGAGKRGSASSLNSLNSCNGKNSNSNINSSSSTSSGSKTTNSNSVSSCNNNMNNATPGTTGTSGNPLTVTNNLTTNSTNTNTNANNTSSSSGENKKTGSVLTNSNSSSGGSNAATTTGKSVRKKEKHSSRKGGRNRMVERVRLLTTIWIGHLISALHWLWTLVVNVSTLSCSLAFTLLEDLYCWWKSNAVPSVRIYYRDGVEKIWEYWVRFKSKIPWWGSRGKSRGADGTGGGGGEAGSEGSSSGGKYGRPRGLNSKDDEILSMMGPERNILLPSNGDEALKRLLSVKGQDPYSILGIRSDSSDETVRRYYKKQAVLVHPDKNVVPGAEEAFKILARAFELVGEPLKRIDYHRQLLEAHEKERVFGEIGNLLEQLRKKMESVSNTIRCTKCNSRHKKNRTDRPLFAARYCAHCRINHAAREGDLWAERKGLFGLSRQYYTCMDSAVWEVNEWASCQKKNLKHLQPDSHNVMYRLVAGAGGGGVGGGGGNGGGNSGPGGPTGPSQGGQSGKTGNVKGHGPSNSNPNHCHDECNGHGSSTGAGAGGHQHQHYHDSAGGDMNDWDTLLSNLRHGANATVNKMANGHGHSHGSGTCTGCNGGSGNPGSTSTADGNIGAGGNSSSARRRGKVKRSK